MSPRDPIHAMTSGMLVDYTLVVLGPSDDVPPGFLLGASRLSVGAGEKDDVFLSGVGVVPAHISLIFLDGRITLLSAGEEIRVDGQVVTQFPLDLQPLQVLSLSPDTHLSYGPVGSKWPAPAPWATAQEENAESSSEQAEGTDEVGVQPLRIAPEKAAKKTVKDHMVSSARMGAVVVGVAVLMIVLVVVSNLIWGEREVVNPNEVAIDQSAVVLEKLLASDPVAYETVRLHRRDDGVLSISGFIDSDVAYQRLAQQVRQQVVSSSGNVRMDTLTRERLAALARDLIGRYPLSSQVDVQGSEVLLTVFGVRTEALDVPRLQADLSHLGQRVSPREFKLVMALEPQDKVTADISAALARYPTTRDLSLSIKDNIVLISGTVAPASEAEARNVLADLQKSYESRLPLTFDLKVDPKLNFTVVSVTMGGNGSSATLMQRGKTESYQEGESVFGVAELKDIRENGVTVQLGRRELFIPLTR